MDAETVINDTLNLAETIKNFVTKYAGVNIDDVLSAEQKNMLEQKFIEIDQELAKL